MNQAPAGMMHVESAISVLSLASHIWKMEEDSGNARADEVGSIPLLESSGSSGRAAGIDGYAADLEDLSGGSTALRTLDSGMDIGDSPWSLAFWVNIDDINGNNQRFRYRGTTATGQWAFDWQLYGSGTCEFRLYDGSDWYALNMNATLTTAAWTHIWLGFDGLNMYSQVNAGARQSLEAISFTSTGLTEFSLGNTRLNGKWDETVFWPFVITEAQVAEHAAGVFA